MRTIRRFARPMQARWALSLILSFMLLLAPVAGAAGLVSPAAAAHNAPVTASVGGPQGNCGAAAAPCS